MEAPSLQLPHFAAVRWPAQLLGLRNNPRFTAVYRLAEACRYEAVHAHQVTRLALKMFNQTAALHRRDPRLRYLLACSALLHDIGYIDGKAGHHKSSLRRICTSSLLNWSARRRRIVGSIARYHRKALPCERHNHFADLNAVDRRRVELLGGLLRLADGLDRGHRCLVRDLQIDFHPRKLTVICHAPECPDWLDRSAQNKLDLLERAADRVVRVEWN